MTSSWDFDVYQVQVKSGQISFVHVISHQWLVISNISPTQHCVLCVFFCMKETWEYVSVHWQQGKHVSESFHEVDNSVESGIPET